MKKFLLSIVIMLFSVNAFALDACHAGAWNDVKRVGEGIAFEVNPKTDEVNGFFYTYDTDNSPFWYVLLGPEDNMLMYGGAKLTEEPFEAFIRPMGVAQILSVSDDLLVFAFDLSLKTDFRPCEEKKGDTCSGEFVYHRITQMIICETE